MTNEVTPIPVVDPRIVPKPSSPKKKRVFVQLPDGRIIPRPRGKPRKDWKIVEQP